MAAGPYLGGPSLLDGPTKWFGPLGGRQRRLQVNDKGQQRQHFLLRKEAVTFGEAEVARWSEDKAYDMWESIRFREAEGVPFCPHCGTLNAYRLTIMRKPRGKDAASDAPVPTRLYKCREGACRRQFSLTSQWKLHGRKMSLQDLAYALMVFVNAVSGEAALRIRRALKCTYKVAFALEGKLREAIAESRPKRLLTERVQVDGKDIGGHDRKGRDKKPVGQPSMKRSILAAREQRPDGITRPWIVDHELHYRDENGDNDLLRDAIQFGTTMVSDEGFTLGYIGPHLKVKHKATFMSKDGVHTNGVEGFFSRVWRAEMGVYYGIVGPYIDLYAEEVAWREDYRRRPNGELWRMLVHAVTHTGKSARWCGYWQRWKKQDAPRRKRPIPCGPRPGAAPATG